MHIPQTLGWIYCYPTTRFTIQLESLFAFYSQGRSPLLFQESVEYVSSLEVVTPFTCSAPEKQNKQNRALHTIMCVIAVQHTRCERTHDGK